MTVVVIQQASPPQVVVSLPAAPVAVTIGIQGPAGPQGAITVGNTAPSDPEINDLWLDTN